MPRAQDRQHHRTGRRAAMPRAPSWSRNRNVDHSATPALTIPNSSAERTSPSLGTSRIGKQQRGPQRAEVIEGQHVRHQRRGNRSGP